MYYGVKTLSPIEKSDFCLGHLTFSSSLELMLTHLSFPFHIPPNVGIHEPFLPPRSACGHSHLGILESMFSSNRCTIITNPNENHLFFRLA